MRFKSFHILHMIDTGQAQSPYTQLPESACKKSIDAAYMANGIVTLAGSRLYTSLADTPEIIDEALNRFEEVFRHVRKTDKGLVKGLFKLS